MRAYRLRGDLVMGGLILHLPDCKEQTGDIESENCPDALDREDRGAVFGLDIAGLFLTVRQMKNEAAP